MILFSIVTSLTLSVYLFNNLELSLYSKRSKVRAFLLALIPFGILFIEQFIFAYNFNLIVGLDFQKAGLYVYSLFKWDFVPVLILSVWAFFIMEKKSFREDLKLILTLGIVLFFVFQMFFDLIDYKNEYDFFNLFLVPMLRAFYMMLFYTVFKRIDVNSLFHRIAAVVSLLLVSLLPGFVCQMYYRANVAGAVLLGLTFFAVAVFIIIFEQLKLKDEE